ncbi:PP2C family serine/threonine-protein phosphatase [Streptomyces sp. CB01881]|uniref:PP2C family protein-serine/threonine phosphatase n=1 Tax=Streptomyces sp. CB01881 TaxID=2078691 RepID=UPI000CDC3F2D|nr:PP2C family serine/threonine-protein phosphatase [Streptomyces sp. CB01881]AUY52476.1 serine/threonine protein phosphatase [Streptomyces sp. CB01881]TYC71903.1 serine/threonine-protein phosphatase [Streptomyces sp. CB01881]
MAAYISVSALSHEGLVREHNEDSLTVGPWTLCATVTTNPQTLLFPLGPPCVVAVADGLGGHPGGEIASALVARELAVAGPALEDEETVRETLQTCNRAVYAAAAGDPGLAAMGTTVAGVVLLPGQAVTFNVGDSRVYRIDGDDLLRVSVDDSPPLPPGRRTTSLVTQTLGGSLGLTFVEPHVRTAPLAAGDRFLVCSDGLTDPVPEEELSGLLAGTDEDDERADGRAAFELWKAAIEAGGPDNITLALVRIGG